MERCNRGSSPCPIIAERIESSVLRQNNWWEGPSCCAPTAVRSHVGRGQSIFQGVGRSSRTSNPGPICRAHVEAKTERKDLRRLFAECEGSHRHCPLFHEG